MQETWVRSLGWEDPLEKEIQPALLQYSCLENPMDRGAWQAALGHKQLDTTEQLTHSFVHDLYIYSNAILEILFISHFT